MGVKKFVKSPAQIRHEIEQRQRKREQAEKKWQAAITERDAMAAECRRYERRVLEAALKIGDWRAPDGYAVFADDLNRELEILRYALEVEKSLDNNVSLRAMDLQ